MHQSMVMVSCTGLVFFPFVSDGLTGLVVKASASRAEDLGFESRLSRDFFGIKSNQ